MRKKLVKHGNSLAIVIERPILELLGMTADSVLDVSTDGKKLFVTVSESESKGTNGASTGSNGSRNGNGVSKDVGGAATDGDHVLSQAKLHKAKVLLASEDVQRRFDPMFRRLAEGPGASSIK